MQIHIPELETVRLKLIAPNIDHLNAHHRIFTDDEVMRYLGGAIDRTEVWDRLASTVGHWQLRGFGMWVVQEKSTGGIIGRAGLRYPDGIPGIEAGWAFTRDSWGKGYATEAASATLGYAFEHLQLARVNAVIHRNNMGSQQVARKLDMKIDESLSTDEKLFYYILRQSWQCAA
jgi:RimJ/RimL family protein N-acetyltransferase